MVKAQILEAVNIRQQRRLCRCTQCLAKLLKKSAKAINKNLYDYNRQRLILRGYLPEQLHASRLQAVLTDQGIKRLNYFKSKALTMS